MKNVTKVILRHQMHDIYHKGNNYLGLKYLKDVAHMLIFHVHIGW